MLCVRRRHRSAGAVRLTRGAARASCQSRRRCCCRHAPIRAFSSFTFGLSLVTGSSSACCRRCARAAPIPDHVEGHDGSIAAHASLFLRKGLVTAQVALSFLLLFGAGLFVRSLQNLKTTETGVQLDNLVTFQVSPAFSVTTTLAGSSSTSSCSSACVGARREDAALASVPILAGDGGTAPWRSKAPGRGRRGHAGVHERPVAGLLRDDEDPDPRRARLQDERRQAGAGRGHRQSTFAEHFFPGQSAVGKHLGWVAGPARS